MMLVLAIFGLFIYFVFTVYVLHELCIVQSKLIKEDQFIFVHNLRIFAKLLEACCLIWDSTHSQFCDSLQFM